MEKRRSGNWAIYAALLLLLLVMLTTRVSTGLFAKFTSTADGASEARVATWDYTLTLAEYDATEEPQPHSSDVEVFKDLIDVLPNVPIEKKLEVSYTTYETGAYLFLIAECEKDTWVAHDGCIALPSALDSGKDMLTIPVSETWSLVAVEEFKDENKTECTRIAFGTLVDPNTAFSDVVFEEIGVSEYTEEEMDAMTTGEKDFAYHYPLSFKAAAISSPGATMEEAWPHVVFPTDSE